MSSNTNPFGGPPLDVDPNYGSQPAVNPWGPRKITIKPVAKDPPTKGGKSKRSKRKMKRRHSRRR